MSQASTGSVGLSWPSIARLGLVQAAIGAVVVLMTSTLNRVMVVELGLLAALPGGLVGLHFAVQILRPRMGFGSDRDGRRHRQFLMGRLRRFGDRSHPQRPLGHASSVGWP